MKQTNERLCALAQKGDATALDSLIDNNKSFIGKVANDIFHSMNKGLSKIDILRKVSIPQLARTIPLKGLALGLEKYRMPDGVIIEVENSSHYLGSFSEKSDASTNWLEKIMEGVSIH